MKVNKFLIMAVFGLLFIQCQKDEELGTIEYYNFKTNIVVNYTADTISMGDTLWLSSEISGYLTDSATQKKIYFKEAGININLIVRSWNVQNQSYQHDNYSFDFITSIGYISYIDKATLIGIYYTSSGGKYLMKFGLVFNSPGTYSVDGDYLKYLNYYNNTEQYFGDGLMEFYNLQNEYKAAYIKSEIQAENHNIHLYQALSDTDKSSFQIVDEDNNSKYFFIKVNE